MRRGSPPRWVLRSSAATAARKSRRVPPRIRCCIRNSDRIDGARRRRRAPRRARCVASDRPLPQRATRRRAASSSASDTGNPRIRCRWPRAVSTSTNGWTACGVVADEDPGGSLAGFRAGARSRWISPSGSRSGRPRWTGWSVVGCVVPQAWSAHSRVCWSPPAPSSRAASSSIRPSSRRRTAWVRAADGGCCSGSACSRLSRNQYWRCSNG